MPFPSDGGRLRKVLGAALLVCLPLGPSGCGTEAGAPGDPDPVPEPVVDVGADATLDGPFDPRDGGLELIPLAPEAFDPSPHRNGAAGLRWMPETVGAGGGWGDVTGDGLPDVVVVLGAAWPGDGADPDRPPVEIHRNNGDGTFERWEVPGLGGPMYGMGVAMADFEGDDDEDLYVTAVGANRLLRNDGSRFTDVTLEMGVAGHARDHSLGYPWSTAAAWFDYDRDGWLDLISCNYIHWSPEGDLFDTRDGTTKAYATPELYESDYCELYRNVAGRGFADVTHASGIGAHTGRALGILFADFDDDGWPDFMVANDLVPNHLFRNLGDGTFEEVADSFGVAVDQRGRARAGMGIDAADLTLSGRRSIGIGNFTHEAVSLYTEVGESEFADLASSAGLVNPTMNSLTFGLEFQDIDLDGYPDLFLANGHIEPDIRNFEVTVTFRQFPQFFWNNQRGRLLPRGDRLGPFHQPLVARGIAFADYDRDGDADALITVNDGPPRVLRTRLRHDTHWARLRLVAAPPNREAIGARVTAFVGDRVLRRMIRTGSGYLTQSETNPVIVGLGGAKRVDSVRVRWPASGRVESFPSVPAGTEAVLVEGEGR